MAELTTLSPPELPTEDQAEEDDELLLSKYNVDILPMDMWDQINKVSIGTAAEPVEVSYRRLLFHSSCTLQFSIFLFHFITN